MIQDNSPFPESLERTQEILLHLGFGKFIAEKFPFARAAITKY